MEDTTSTIQPQSAVKRLRSSLGLERNILTMLVALLVIGMGEELWMRFIPKYLETLGATAWVIALYGTLKDLLDAVYQYPGGWLTDKLGRRNALIVFTLVAIAGYAFYIIGASWEVVLIGTIFVSAWASLSSPAVFAIIGDTLPSTHRSIGFGVQSILKRVPIVIAPVIGGWLIASLGLTTGMKIGLAITIVLAALSIIIVRKFYIEKAAAAHEPIPFRTLWKGLDARLKRLLVADCLARWAEGIPKVFIVLFVMNIAGHDAVAFGTLTSIQMIAAIVVYIPIAKMSDRMNRKPFVLLTFIFFALFPLSLVVSNAFPIVAAAFVIGGLREVGEPARKAMIVDLAREHARGRTVGAYYLVRGLAVFPASLVGGWLWEIRPELPFILAFVIGVIGCLVYAMMSPSETHR